jgi:hypothetical protein
MANALSVAGNNSKYKMLMRLRLDSGLDFGTVSSRRSPSSLAFGMTP